MSKCIYNNQTFDVSFILTRLDKDQLILEVKGPTKLQVLEGQEIDENPIDGTSAENTTNLVNEYLSSIAIYNNFDNPYPYIEFEYMDMGTQTIVRYPADGHTTLVAVMVLIAPDGETTTLRHIYNVVDVKPVLNTKDFTTFKIKAVSVLYNSLAASVEYSTGGDKPEYPTKIARDILKKVEYPIKEIDYQSSVFGNLESRYGATIFENPVIESSTETKMVYISPANYTVTMNVDYLLKMASRSKSSGMFYFLYNMYDSVGYIYNPNAMFNKIDPANLYSYVLPFNVATIPGREGDSGSELLNINDFRFQNYIGGHNMFNYTGKTTLYNFDYLNRRLVKDVYKLKDIQAIVPALNESNKTFQSIYKDKSDLFKMNKYDREDVNWAYSRLYEKTDMLFRMGNVMEFRMMGNILRDAGQLMVVRAPSTILNLRYGGIYMIMRVRHSFTNKRYINDIVAVRTMELKLKV